MVVVQKIAQGQFQPGIIGKGGNPGHQTSRISVGGTDVVENVSSRFLFQLNVAALGYGYETILDLPCDTAGGIAEQRRKLILKVVFLVCLTDEVQHGQALFLLRQTQATAQLLQEHGQ